MSLSKKLIDAKFTELCKLTNGEKTNDSKYYLAYDFNSNYGGYRLNNIKKDGGTHYGAFGKNSTCSRMSAKEFYQYLCGLIEGIEFVKTGKHSLL